MLSDDFLWHQATQCTIGGDIHIIKFSRAIEAEVRKQDDALILQLVEALEVATTPLAKDRQEVLRAIAAANARLEGT